MQVSVRSLARWIEAVSWAFAALGLVLPVAFFAAPFTPYRDALAHWAYGARGIPDADRELAGLLLGITGGSIAGKWIVHAAIARGPLAEGRAWARDATILGLLAWFAIDSALSLRAGAAFNVWMINLLPIALVGAPLVALGRAFADNPRPGEDSAEALPRIARACFWTALVGASTGLAIAFGGETSLFTPWFSALEHAQYAGAALAAGTRRLALFFFGPIGGCTFAQFTMLAIVIRRDGATRRAAFAGAGSIAAWFVIDSGYGLVHGGLFNILMINVPGLAATLPPWLLLARTKQQQRGRI